MSLESEFPFELILTKCDLLPTRQQSISLAKRNGVDIHTFESQLLLTLSFISRGQCSYHSSFFNKKETWWALYYAFKRNWIEITHISKGDDSLREGFIYMITIDGVIALYRLRRGENIFEDAEF